MKEATTQLAVSADGCVWGKQRCLMVILLAYWEEHMDIRKQVVALNGMWTHGRAIHRMPIAPSISSSGRLRSRRRRPLERFCLRGVFHPCGVGIAQALFATILLYFAAEKVLGTGGTAGDALERGATRSLGPQVGPKWVCAATQLAADVHSEGPTPVSAVLRAYS